MADNNNHDLDFEKLGLKSGIEIHAQLEGKKLFCNCPTTIREDECDFAIQRKLKAVVGETGKIDIAAKREQEKNKSFVYQGYNDTTCLVEIDEEPPHLMNKGALNLCLQMCKYLNCKVVDEVQIMRKTVVDGSNTSGFQRTSLVGYNGKIDVDGSEIVIESVAIEEDSCKIVERKAHEDIYNLSRLGIPLIEIATGPNMKTPKEIAAVAAKIGMFLRSLTPNQGQSIKRGLGTIRQDVNVSITKGNRVEIKGAQDLKMIPTIVEYETMRQMKIVDIMERIESGKLKIDISGPDVDLNSVFSKTECKFIASTIADGGHVFGIKVGGMNGIIGEETMPGRRLGSEISDYGKLAGVGGLIHSDEKIEKYNFTEKEVAAVRKELELGNDDAFILVADKKGKALKALEYIRERISRLGEGVIKEVRKANADGTTSYMRPMPGGARMYPETDTMPVAANLEDVEIGKTIDEKIADYVKLGIKNQDIAKKIAREFSELFDKLLFELKSDANNLATTLVSGSSVYSEMEYDVLFTVLKAMDDSVIPKNAFLEVLEMVQKGTPVEEAIKSKESMPREEVEKIVDSVLAEVGEVDPRKMGMIMGKVMQASKGKADGKIVSEIIRSKLN